MKRRLTKIMLFTGLLVLLAIGNALAANITLQDGRVAPSGDSWYTNPNENQEVEPGMVIDQRWDLEAFLLNGWKLTVQSGFNLQAGYGGYSSGDIFISTDSIPTPSVNGSSGTGWLYPYSNYGYEYVVDINWNTGAYDVYDFTKNTPQVQSTWYRQNNSSNPYKRVSGGEFVEIGSIEGYTSWTDPLGPGYEGAHYAATIDLGFLGANQEFWTHFTMGCGNDNMMGYGTTPVPEPATMLLLGTGLVGLAGFGRRKFRKNQG